MRARVGVKDRTISPPPPPPSKPPSSLLHQRILHLSVVLIKRRHLTFFDRQETGP